MQKQTILILDDERDIHYVFDRYLGEKYNLIHAVDEEEALQKCIKNHNIDLVITDVFLGKKMGFEFVYKIRDMERDVPIIIMSAYGNRFTEDLIENIKDTFKCVFISKPFDNDEMEKLIEGLMLQAV